ncbi:MAG: threonylcarbamoyl-AMP synthase [Verrucomicrobia bacterium]|nr:threonylcarbamoyl-AMP synthase [Verrucomicrobiota bacterium]
MNTVILDAQTDSSASVAAAVGILREKGLVALPTETVYGLAGDALAPEAVAKIFETKERPSFDPLIVHIENREWLARLTRFPENAKPVLQLLIDRFWPGPLTILFPKSELVADLVTAGLDEVAIRMSRHLVFAGVLRAFGKPLAAPSANRFGRVSPTRAEHVLDELGGRIPLILDAGPAPIGLESTVIRVTIDKIEILRHGAISEEDLAKIAPTGEVARSPRIVAPGQTASHYAPDKIVELFDPQAIDTDSRKDALICWGPIQYAEEFSIVRSLSETHDLRVAAQRLFSLLRELDRSNVRRIMVEPVPDIGLGKAIMNRIRRATAPRGGAGR